MEASGGAWRRTGPNGGWHGTGPDGGGTVPIPMAVDLCTGLGGSGQGGEKHEILSKRRDGVAF
jgi:hypothetical protein